ncbi:msx2-interacting protein isoform X2 [Coregonus clupeaformis]|uniref:msx2-interacting protein isoform X2 n=1 Tax=Coregonus clupeaformis TaxID=59861 RepID=UPI001BE069AE|nr:msx2-interacting protein isoform X2 [Coregonus clupeaformis]
MVRETRHLWVGNLPENVREEKIIEHFKRYGRVESVKVLPKRGSEGGVAAFVDFVDIKSAQKAHNSINKMGDRDLRTDYNEPGTIPSAVRGLDNSLSLGCRGRDVSGFTRAAGGLVYGPPALLHSREGRYERRLDGTAESRDRAYDHSAYGHHERAGSSFDRQRHYESDYYRDTRERTLNTGSGTASGGGGAISAGVVGGVVGAGVSACGTGGGAGAGGSGGSSSVGVGYYRSHSRSPSHFDTPEPQYDTRPREPFILASIVHRDLYQEERGRRGDRSYPDSCSRSPHSSHSRNLSPQRLASQATWPPGSHSGSGSRSRSSSSNSVSSTSSSNSGSDSSSSSSDDSPARSVQSAAVPAPSALPLSALDKDEHRKSFGVKVQNLPVRSTDTSLKDGLFHEFKKYGKVTSVQIHGALEERYGLVFFRQQEDQEKALGASKGKLFFGMQIEVIVWNGPGASTTETESENEFRPLDERIDEFHPKATRTLFIGNLEKTTSYHDLLNIFQRFGEIVDIDIKKVNGAPQYAFLQYCDIASVCKAIMKMDGEYLCNHRLKLGFGKSMPTTCVWLDGLASNITEQYLTRHFCRYGHVVKVVFDKPKGMALILYNNIDYAQAAVKETKGWKMGGNKIKVDFANQESQMAFYRSMQASGQDIRDFYEILSERRDERRPQYEFTAERPLFDNSVRTPGGAFIEDPRRKLPARGREFYTEWDPYQGDFYDPRYFDDPREYRDHRDPYEQDIRKYSYLQRERERERFETDRERDHGRRTIEHSQSPSHPNHPASPTVSPSLSERLPSDSDRCICCRSSEQSCSCSSLSPPRFDKPDKARPDRYNKSDKPEKERSFEGEHGIGGEKEKRAGRKEKGEKEKGEKRRLRKLKLQSTSIPSPETDPELEREDSPGLRSKVSKFPPKEKEGLGKGQLDLPPCVVQLTRVKEKEGKLLGHAVLEKQRLRGENDSIRLASPSSDQNSPSFRIDPQKGDIIKHRKVPKDKNMARLVEVVENDGKINAKKHMKAGPGFDGSNSVDVDRLAARKRRFEESMLKTDRLKRASQEEEEGGRLGLRKTADSAMAKENKGDKSLFAKGVHKKEHRKAKSERLVTVCSPKDKQESDIDSMGMGLGLSLELQSRLGEPTEDEIDPFDPPCLKMEFWGSKIQSSLSLMKISDGSLDQDAFNVQPQEDNGEQGVGLYKSREETEEQLASDIDHSQSCKKQMEQSRQLWQKLEEPDKSDKRESPQGSNTEDFERCSLLHEVGKPPQDVTDDSPSNKCKRSESFDFDLLSAKRERHYRSSRELNEDLGRSVTAFSGSNHFPSNEEVCASQLSQSVTNKETKDSPKEEDKVFSHVDSLKYSLDMTPNRLSSPNTEFPKSKTTLLGCDEELLQRWESRIESDSLRMDMTFPSSIVKRENIRKRLVPELEPGEVQSDSDNDSENKNHSPKPNTSLSSILREREESLTDLKFSGSLEKNKFYSFALDKTITPDTKALLERAKSLSSSREDNWSFLDRDSRFASLHSSSDKEKVESAPRPIPSWDMKKKKIRTDSEGKLDDKKEDPKAEDQQRQELFASRFLHSSIFEQDSRRLQHLERKDPDPKLGFGRHLSKQDSVEGQPEPGGVDLQEPIVLFHSRFLELQQQKETSRDHFPTEIESVDVVDESEGEQVQNEQQEGSPKVSEFMQKADIKSVGPSLILPISQFLPSPREISPQQEKEAILTSSSEQTVSLIKEEQVEHNHDVSPPQSPPLVEIQPPSSIVITPLCPVLSEAEVKVEPKEELCEPKVTTESNVTVDHASFFDVKPPTPGASLSSFEAETAEFPCSASHKIEENMDMVKMEVQPEKPDSKDFDTPHKSEASQEVHMPVSETEMKPAKPIGKQPKSKRAKPNVSVTQILNPPETIVSEKPVTRKSERIDREKLKRSSSPRGEISSEPITTAKSPVHALDSENESSLILGRTRRRNVRSIYATPSEGEAQPPGKEVVDYLRATRKRGVDKEPVQQLQQDALNTSTNTRRGNPPKSRRRGEDVSPVKGDSQKTSEEDIDIKEPVNTGEGLRMSEGWHSPHMQKVQNTHVSSPTGTSVGRKASRVDKQSESATSPGEKSGDSTTTEEPKIKDESEEAGKLLEEAKQCLPTQKDEKDKELTDQIAKKSSEGDIERIESTYVEKRQQSEKSGKVKEPRLTQNSKLVTEDKLHCLRNLEIRVSVDDVKGLLCSGEDESESFETTAKNAKPGVPNKEETRTQYLKEAAELSPEERDVLLGLEPPVDPAAALLARQMELERAVENIAKLTVEKPLQPYKEPPAEPRTLLPPVTVEPDNEIEGEKSANPASETELAAAIDSITAEDISTDTDGFTAPPTYTALVPTPEPLVSPSANEVLAPETRIIDPDPEMGVLIPSDKPLTPDAKASESSVSGASAQDESPPPETPKKTGKAVRAKTPKRSRGRKACVNRKGETAEEVPEPETSPIKLTESIPEDMEIINSKAATAAATAATATVVTAAATCKRDITCTMTVYTPKEAEQPAVEQPVPEESAFHSSTKSPPHFKKLQLSAVAPALSPSLALTPSPTQLNVPPPRPGKMPVSPDWLPRSEESRIHATPAIQVNVVTPSAPAVTALGNQSANPSMPPDTKASDIDPSSSTLRKILMEPKYVSASNSNAIPTTVLTTTLADLRMSENENLSDTMTAWHKHLEDRPSPLIPHPTFQKPSPLTETQQNFGEKIVHSVIFPTTSVISRIPMPYDTEEAPRISLSNRNAPLSLPKQKFRSSMNENNRYHGVDVAEDVNSRGRSVVESTPYNTDSSPGLRVNTSQGVVVLSYSGQKTEVPQRISAKISQIPPASAVDIEFQQSVSKSQIKQEPLTPSQPSTPKGPLTPAGYGHPGVLLTGQSYNSQPVISTIKQESPVSDKSESSYHTGLQGSTVMMIQQKMIQQPVTNPQVLMYNQAVMQQHMKKRPGVESIPMMADMAKAHQTSNLSQIMNPHHPSLTGNRMSPSPSTPTDQSVPHLKQEPYSPRTTGHSPSPFAKVCPPSNSMSPHGSSMVLHPGMPEMSLYISSMHHPHPEQSVIMTPVSHSVTQSVSMGRHCHGEVRMNTPHISGINYGRRADFQPSSHAGPSQRSNMPAVIRDMVVQSHAGPTRGASDHSAEEDIRHYHQGLCRSSAPQLQSDVMMMQAEQQRGLHHAGLRLDQYSMASRDIRDIRDMRILMHHQLGENTIAEGRQSQTPEAGATSITNISAASKSPLVGKGMTQMGKETPKPLEAKMSHPPHTESSRIIGVHSSVPVMVSPHHHPQGVQLIHPGGAGSFPMYRDMRGFHSQFSSHSSMGFNLASRGITPSQDCDLGHRGKLSQSLSARSLDGGYETKSDNSHLIHTASKDLSHMPRMQSDTISPSYASPMALSHKQELVLQKGPPVFMSSPPAAPLSSSSELHPEGKLGHSGYRSVDMVQLLMKYPIVWQGLLALKNDSAAVQLHFVSGNNVLAHHSLPPLEGSAPLRIAQRMRLEASQLEGVARRMMVESDYCLLLALPCGRDQEDVLSQTLLLKGGFITYLQQKQAAGIINVPNPGSNQPAYVVQIFPPCEFSESHLSRLAPDLLNSISSISPHLMIVIASV